MMNVAKRVYVIFFFLLQCFISPIFSHAGPALPPGFVYVEDIVPGVTVDLRYLSDDNFVGKRVNGYVRPHCIATREAAQALRDVREELQRFSLDIMIFDAYRPQRSVDHFVRWAKDLSDTKMKAKYYPDVPKSELFRRDYIAVKSSHSRGSAFDLTLVYFDKEGKVQQLDMGTGFDLFDPKSRPDEPSMTPQQRAHRMLLQLVMESHGFRHYSQEWWHFTLADEPYPDTYFDFPVE